MKNKLVSTLNGMGIGLLATLVVGTILVQIASLIGSSFLNEVGGYAKVIVAAAIGAGVAQALKVNSLVLYPTLVTAMMGAGAIQMIDGKFILSIGEPVGAYVAAIVTVWVGSCVIGKTKVDILLVPMACLITGGLVGVFVSPITVQLTQMIGYAINEATQLEPLYMGAIIAMVMCLVILSPISSAALAVSLGLDGLAAGAAVVGCSCSMISFAVISYQENGVGGLISQGLGTSKIQFANAVKNPWIIIPSVGASLICGMLSTTVFSLKCNSVGAGMGSSGLVGQIQTFAVMGHEAFLGVVLLHFILPAFISYSIFKFISGKGFVKSEDLRLALD